ncbi:hypothetical protein MW887_011006 [Aspergillus wentii]|nr:hypothetical protein MW887_011006 [Aspergillus wentii]
MVKHNPEEFLKLRPPPLPEFRNLEIRGTWSGKQHEPVDLQISLEVQCIPNTRLQLLDARSKNVLVNKTSSACLQSYESVQGNWSAENSPQSPVFTFPDDDGHNASSSSIHALDTSEELYAGDLESNSETPTETASSHRDSASELPDYEDCEDVGPPLQSSSSSPICSSKLCLTVAKCQDWGEMQNLGKRSATEACLSDSEPEITNRKNASKGAASKKGNTGSSCEKSVDSARSPSSSTYKSSISSKRHSRKPSLIPKRIWIEKPVPKLAPSEQPSDDSLISLEYSQSLEGENYTLGVMGSATRERKDGDLFSTPTETRLGTAGPGALTLYNNVTERDVTKHGAPVSYAGQKGVLRSSHPPLDPLALHSDEDASTDIDESDDGTAPSTPLGPLGLTLSRTTVSESDEALTVIDTDGNGRLTHECEDCQPSTGEPELCLVDGILLVKTPPGANPATYKFFFTVSIYLQEGKSDKWSNLVVPGLPRLKASESGLFVFHMPEDHTMEFEGTRFAKHKTTQNYFLGVFFDSGLNDLVVPLRVCKPKACSTVKGFAIDQEIRAEYVISTTEGGDGKANQTCLLVKYEALCSLRFHSSRFWAERCCFLLSVDGGPEGFFRCNIDSKSDDVAILDLDTGDKSIGISRIRVFCAPRDLDMFFVRWEVKLPRNSGNNKVQSWMPRLYSVPFERKRGQMRQAFARIEVEVQKADDLEKETVNNVGHKGCQETFGANGFLENNVQSSNSSTALTLAPPMLSGENMLRAEKGYRDAVISHIRRLGMSPKQIFIIISCGVVLLWSIFAVLEFGPPYFYTVKNSVQKETNLGLYPTTAGYSGLEEGSPRDKISGIRCDFARTPLVESNQNNSVKDLGSSDMNVDAHEPLSDNQEDSVGHGANTVEENSIEIEKQMTLSEDNPEEMASQEDMEMKIELREVVSPSSLSFRDRIDYMLGWRGPVGR